MTRMPIRSIVLASVRDPSPLAIGVGLFLALAAGGCQDNEPPRAAARIAEASAADLASCDAAQLACDEQQNACLDAIWNGPSSPDDGAAAQRACEEAALECTYAIPCNQTCMGACSEALDRCEMAGSGSSSDDDACYADYQVCIVEECDYDYPAACAACDQAAEACYEGLDIDDPASAAAYQACFDSYVVCWESTCPLP